MTNLPTIEHPTGQANCTFVTFGPVELAFSYGTVIGFRAGAGRWIVSENCWGPTTAKHINLVPGGDDKANRVERGLFEAQLAGCIALVTAGVYRTEEVAS